MVKEVYQLTANLPSDEKYVLVSQIRRATISIPSNISEGSSRKSKTEKSRFFEIARSSLVELDTQIEICVELKLLTKGDIDQLTSLANEVFAMLTAMKR